jgi:Xaa-Pro aminopeptidase
LVRPISLGAPPDDFLELFNIHKEMYRQAVRELHPENSATEIEEKVSGWGHGQRDFSFASPGLQMLDNMFRTPLYLGELKAGMVFMVHAITFPSSAEIEKRTGHGGHLIGDTYIVTEGAPESMTKLPFEVTVV